MNQNGHLELHELALSAGREWMLPGDAWVFLRVQDGSAYLLARPSSCVLNTGDVMAVSQKSQWQIRSSQLFDLKAHYFCFQSERLSGLFSLAEEHAMLRIARQVDRAPDIFKSEHPVAGGFEMLVNQLHHSGTFAQRTQMLGIIAAAFRGDLTKAPPQDSEVSGAECMANIIRTLSTQDLARRSVEEMASHCGCSARHFSRLFKAQFGRTFQSKRTEARLRQACQLLENTQEKISNLALDCGYQHAGLFCTAFKKKFGMSPSRWRRKHTRASR